MLRLLVVTAHPDDEAGGFGGTLLLYRRRRIETYVICLTPGQAARNRGGARSDEELAMMRRQEFANACKLLEVTRCEVLDFSDASLDQTDFNSMVEPLTLRVRQIKPHVMLTFGPDGSITAHPDHSMASLVATMAFHWAGRSNRFAHHLEKGIETWRAQKLYYSTWPGTLTDRQAVSLSPWSCAIEIREFVQTKLAAFKVHTTQNPLYELFARNVERFGSRELFHLVARSEPGAMTIEADLFAGVSE